MSNVHTRPGVYPRHVYYYSDALRVKTRYTPGYAYECECGDRGKWRATWKQAVVDYRAHKRECSL